MIKRFFLISCVVLNSIASTAWAEAFIDAEQVTQLFSGKSVKGKHLKKGYTFTRYFSPDGKAYGQREGMKNIGAWRVDDNGAHCIKWDISDKERCRRIKDNGDGTYTMVKEKGFNKKAIIVYNEFIDGNVLNAQVGSGEVSNAAVAEANARLLKAVKSKSLEKLIEAINAGANPNFMFEKNRNALFFAVDGANGRIIDLLIKHGADVNAKDAHGNTPLIFATKRKDLKAVQLFLHYGANSKATNDAGESAFNIAKDKELFQIAEVLQQNSEAGEALGLFVDMRGRKINLEQFRRAAVKAFEARNWRIEQNENNEVTGTYERNDRIFKSRMIYEPDFLLIKFDYAMGYKKANYLEALKNVFFRELNNM